MYNRKSFDFTICIVHTDVLTINTIKLVRHVRKGSFIK